MRLNDMIVRERKWGDRGDDKQQRATGVFEPGLAAAGSLAIVSSFAVVWSCLHFSELAETVSSVL